MNTMAVTDELTFLALYRYELTSLSHLRSGKVNTSREILVLHGGAATAALADLFYGLRDV
jgi:hypothetical protein